MNLFSTEEIVALPCKNEEFYDQYYILWAPQKTNIIILFYQ